LIDELEIAGNVEWLPVMHKNLLIQYYNAADIVFDQFLLGAFGTTAPEAMSCERPVVGYAEPDMWIRQHGSIPPVANARTAEDIYERMVELESTSLRRQYGRRGRKWVLETCEMTLVARRQLEVCQQVIER
jgi:glycosyltransferase involved in cell wall biosynthesis